MPGEAENRNRSVSAFGGIDNQTVFKVGIGWVRRWVGGR